jgi:predicted NAD/FAD-binding protein
VIVSLNPLHAPRPGTVLRRIAYAHPVFDNAAIAAQARLAELQGRSRVWFCGAWTGYGFHEDGLKSGQQVADRILAQLRAGHTVAPVAAQSSALPLREAA